MGKTLFVVLCMDQYKAGFLAIPHLDCFHDSINKSSLNSPDQNCNSRENSLNAPNIDKVMLCAIKPADNCHYINLIHMPRLQDITTVIMPIKSWDANSTYEKCCCSPLSAPNSTVTRTLEKVKGLSCLNWLTNQIKWF